MRAIVPSQLHQRHHAQATVKRQSRPEDDMDRIAAFRQQRQRMMTRVQRELDRAMASNEESTVGLAKQGSQQEYDYTQQECHQQPMVVSKRPTLAGEACTRAMHRLADPRNFSGTCRFERVAAGGSASMRGVLHTQMRMTIGEEHGRTQRQDRRERDTSEEELDWRLSLGMRREMSNDELLKHQHRELLLAQPAPPAPTQLRDARLDKMQSFDPSCHKAPVRATGFGLEPGVPLNTPRWRLIQRKSAGGAASRY